MGHFAAILIIVLSGVIAMILDVKCEIELSASIWYLWGSLSSALAFYCALLQES